MKTYEKEQEEEEERVLNRVDSSTDPPTFDWVEFSSSEGALCAPEYLGPNSKFSYNFIFDSRHGWIMIGVDDDDDDDRCG